MPGNANLGNFRSQPLNQAQSPAKVDQLIQSLELVSINRTKLFAALYADHGLVFIVSGFIVIRKELEAPIFGVSGRAKSSIGPNIYFWWEPLTKSDLHSLLFNSQWLPAPAVIAPHFSLRIAHTTCFHARLDTISAVCDIEIPNASAILLTNSPC